MLVEMITVNTDSGAADSAPQTTFIDHQLEAKQIASRYRGVPQTAAAIDDIFEQQIAALAALTGLPLEVVRAQHAN